MAYIPLVPYADVTFGDAAIAEMSDQGSWTSSTSADKLRYLQSASRLIDTLPLIGWKTSTTQDQEFPRFGDSAIPYAVSMATVILARDISSGLVSTTPSLNLKKEKIGDAEWEYFDSASVESAFSWLSDEAMLYLAPYIKDPRVLYIDRA
jgi:hypothetical protein